MPRFPFLLALFFVGCSSTPQVEPGNGRSDANEVRREVNAGRSAAFQAMKSALFAKGYILLPADEASGVVRTEWTGERENVALSVMRFIFTRHEDPQIMISGTVSPAAESGRSVYVMNVHGRHKVNTFWKQRWSEPYPLPRSDELARLLGEILDEATRSAETGSGR